MLLLSFGGTVEKMLEYFAWTMLAVVFGFLLMVNLMFVPFGHWWTTFQGFFSFSGIPRPIDWGSDRGPGCNCRLWWNRQPDDYELGS